jgi:hypothetical protein
VSLKKEILIRKIFKRTIFLVMYYNVRISQWARSICTCWAAPPEATPLLSASHQEKQLESTGELIVTFRYFGSYDASLLKILVDKDEARASTSNSSEDSLLSWLRSLDFSSASNTQQQCQVQNEEQGT